MTDDKQTTGSSSGTERPVEFRFDGNFQESLQTGLGALQQVFSGFAKMAQNAVGPEFVRNVQAGSWLTGVADCLDAVASARVASGSQQGELACYVERIDSELAGSKFAAQKASFEKRLGEAVACAGHGNLSDSDIQVVSAAAGYFRASAKSVMSFSAGSSPSNG